MYVAHFGLGGQPFYPCLLPASRFLAGSTAPRSPMLDYRLEKHGGFAVLTGAIGFDQTSPVRHLLEHAARDLVVGLVSNTHPGLGDQLSGCATHSRLAA